MCTVLCVCALCAPYLSKKCIRMFRKSAFNPVHQKSALYLEKQRCWKNSANSALCSNVGLDMTTPFKLPAQKKLKISEKLVEKQRKCAAVKFIHILKLPTLATHFTIG